MTPSRKSPKGVKSGPDFTRNNYLILGLGLLFIVVGFIFLGILLVLGYCVIIPLGILFPKKKEKREEPA
jgi:hypothetical protein